MEEGDLVGCGAAVGTVHTFEEIMRHASEGYGVYPILDNMAGFTLSAPK